MSGPMVTATGACPSWCERHYGPTMPELGDTPTHVMSVGSGLVDVEQHDGQQGPVLYLSYDGDGEITAEYARQLAADLLAAAAMVEGLAAAASAGGLDYARLGAEIARRVAASGRSVRSVAAEARMPLTTFRAKLRGRVIGVYELARIANALGAEPAEILHAALDPVTL